MTEREKSAIRNHAAQIGATLVAMKNTPPELTPFAMYVPDSGYCILVIPHSLRGEDEGGVPFNTSVPIPTKYVLEKGYTIENERVYCDVPYDSEIGADVPEEYCVYERVAPSEAYIAIEKGHPYPPVVGYPDGVFFDMGTNGARVIVNMSRPTAEEMFAFQAGEKLRIGLFREDGILFLLFKFGNQQWMDAPYNPALGTAPTLPDIPGGGGLALTCLMTDAPYGTVVGGPRIVGLPTAFSMEFVGAVRELVANPITGGEYNRRLQRVMNQYSTDDMVRDAIMIVEV